MNAAKKRVLTRLAQDFYRPAGLKELAEDLSLTETMVEATLASLAEDKILLKNGEGYSLNPGSDIIAGFFQSHARGYGFVHVGGDRQYYLAPGFTGGARDGDILLCQVLAREAGKAPAVRILDFLLRSERIIVSVFNGQTHLGSVQVGNKRIMIPSRHAAGAEDGDGVLVSVSGWEGRVKGLLATEDLPYVDLFDIAANKGVLPVFPDRVEAEAAALEQDCLADGRLDLRGLEVVTVDGDDVQDLDDGFSLSREADGRWRLGIHIADVAQYVPLGSQLEREAFRRAKSVYLVNREAPMLPRRLSRGLCSLLPGCDRLAISCLAVISAAGEVVGYEFAETLVRSRQQLTYSQAEGAGSALIKQADQLAQLLHSRRKKRGAAYIELPATAITLDGEGRPVSMGPQQKGGPRKLVEEFMILANELAADWLYKKGAPLLYRGNEGFYGGRDSQLLPFLAQWGHTLDYPPTSGQLQQMLEQIEGQPEELPISRKLARSLHKSRYSWRPLGHYNLALERYTHFSSPIRRYADLFVHHQLKRLLHGQPALERDLPRVAEQCSFRERLAQDIENACLERKKMEYMAGQEDRDFRGLVTDMTPNGPLVWLENTAEGILSAGDERIRAHCRPGDRVSVRIHRLNHGANTIYFSGQRDR